MELQFLPILFIIIGVIASLVSKASKAAAKTSQPMGRPATSRDEELRRQVQSLQATVRQDAPQLQLVLRRQTPISKPNMPEEGESSEAAGYQQARFNEPVFTTQTSRLDVMQTQMKGSLSGQYSAARFGAEQVRDRTALMDVTEEDDIYSTNPEALPYKKSSPIKATRTAGLGATFISAEAMASAVILTEIFQRRGGRKAEWKH
jgi:hypothetical protein